MLSIKTFAALSLLAVAFAEEGSGIGTMFITNVNGVPQKADERYIAVANKVVAAEKMSVFTDERTAVKLYNKESYMSVNAQGELIMSDEPNFDVIIDLDDDGSIGHLHYNGDEVFELCDDKSIRYRSGCGGARDITITFEDLLG